MGNNGMPYPLPLNICREWMPMFSASGGIVEVRTENNILAKASGMSTCYDRKPEWSSHRGRVMVEVHVYVQRRRGRITARREVRAADPGTFRPSNMLEITSM